MPRETGCLALDQRPRRFPGVALEQREQIIVRQRPHGFVPSPDPLAPEPRPRAVLGVQPDRQAAEPLIEHALLAPAHEMDIRPRTHCELSQQL
jgi:hypothetical protein